MNQLKSKSLFGRFKEKYKRVVHYLDTPFREYYEVNKHRISKGRAR